MASSSGKRPNDFPSTQCQYGENCYRKNPSHFSEYRHSHLDNIIRGSKGGNYNVPDEYSMTKDIILEQIAIIVKLFPDLPEEREPKVPKVEEVKKKEEVEKPLPAPAPVPAAKKEPFAVNQSLLQKLKESHPSFNVNFPRGQMEEKLKAAAPYNVFMPAITASPATHTEPLTITLQEILDRSLGDLECSLQINFMVQIGWLLGHYRLAGYGEKPLLILYGSDDPDLLTINQNCPNIEAVKVPMSGPFGIHHTKMMLLGYTDGSMRVVISTANLYVDDWDNRSQGLWMSPRLPRSADPNDPTVGEAPTEFRRDLLQYLMAYNMPKLQSWITRVRKTDFSAVNVFLVASVPGGHRNTPRGHSWGHPRLGHLLAQHSARIDESCPIVAQSSSIGTLGQSVDTWILGEWGGNFRKDSAPAQLRRMPRFKMIYPSFNNVMSSHDNILGGGCLPYSRSVNEKQPWLKNHLHQWKSNKRHRSQAMPHIKSYCRWSDRGLYWFVLTSANLSKAAWGCFNKAAKIEPPLRINNYEAGVLFLPKFINQGEVFPLTGEGAFPMPYDIPLTPYGADDTPFLFDFINELGNMN